MNKIFYLLLAVLFLNPKASFALKVIQADGKAQSYNLDGSDGSNGWDGSTGSSPGCSGTGGSSDVSEPSGGNGQDGGSGQDGDDGDSILVYYSSADALKLIHVSNSGGDGGRGGSGGRGGDGCSCSQSSWSITDSDGTAHYYSCSSGSDGSHGSDGSNGSDGSYGDISLVNSVDPLLPDAASASVDLAKVESAPVVLAQNIWVRKAGAHALFDPHSDIVDSYRLFQGRVTKTVIFKWAAASPASDFAGYHVSLSMEDDKVSVRFPEGLWIKSDVQNDGDVETIVVQDAIKISTVTNLAVGAVSGRDETLALSIEDKSGESAEVQSTVSLKYYTWSNGAYVQRFVGAVPEAAVTATASGLKLALGSLAIDKAYLKAKTYAYVDLEITRALHGFSTTQHLTARFLISDFYVGDTVEAIADANLYSVDTVVDHVKKGEHFTVTGIQDNWVSLKRLDGAGPRGWISRDQLKAQN